MANEFDNKETFNAWYALSMNGQDVGHERRMAIKSIEIEENTDSFDTCTIRIEDPNMLYISDDLYIEDTPMSVDMGFHNGTPYSVQFYGYIAAIDIEFDDTGIPKMELFCVDKSHLMNRVKNSRTWKNTTSATVVQYFAKQYGFRCVVEEGYPFIKQESISQSDETDIEFLQKLAQDEIQPFVCKLIGETLYYIKKGLLSPPVRSLCYNKYPYEIRSFKPQINRETKTIETKYANMTTDKVIDVGIANDINTARELQGYPVSTTDVPFGSVPYTQPKTKDKTSSSSKKEADKKEIKLEMTTLTGEIELRTFPNLLLFKAFQTVIIDGIGKYLSGMYFITTVKRTLDSDGFTQSLSVLKNGFGDSLKMPDSKLQVQTPESAPLQLSVNKPIGVGSPVRICDTTAKWAKEEDGVAVPEWVKTEIMRVQQMDGDLCLLMPINKWTHISYLVYQEK